MEETARLTEEAVIAELAAADDAAVRLRLHDASRVEWIVALPLPEERRLAYQIDVALEVPSSAAAGKSPWDQLQSFTRLDGPTAIATSEDVTIDALRRGAVTVSQMLVRARDGFARHCRLAQAGQASPDFSGKAFLNIWLDAALRSVRDARDKLTRAAATDTPDIGRERALIDEFASVKLLDMLAESERVAREAPPGGEVAVIGCFEGVRARIHETLAGEMARRKEKCFLRTDASSPENLERYIARSARLKKHFEEVLFLDRESEQLDERLDLWSRVAGALLAGTLATLPLQLVLARRAQPQELGWGLMVLAILTGLIYALRESIKERGRTWLSRRFNRFQSQRVLRCRVPHRRLPSRDLLVTAREWCRQFTSSRPDPLNPQAGASLRVTDVEYRHKGTVRQHPHLWAAGVRRVLHIFRYDLSPLLPRLDDEPKAVPVADAEGNVAFVATPRRYRVPIRVTLKAGGEQHEQRATLVVDRGGLRRIEFGSDAQD